MKNVKRINSLQGQKNNIAKERIRKKRNEFLGKKDVCLSNRRDLMASLRKSKVKVNCSKAPGRKRIPAPPTPPKEKKEGNDK